MKDARQDHVDHSGINSALALVGPALKDYVAIDYSCPVQELDARDTPTLFYAMSFAAGSRRVPFGIEAFTLGYRHYGVRAYRVIGQGESLRAAWTIGAPVDRSIDDQQPFCIRCLRRHQHDRCLERSVDIKIITAGDLTKAVVDWFRHDMRGMIAAQDAGVK